MRAAVVNAIGGTPTCGEFPEPASAADDEVIVEVALAGLNPVDKLSVDGYANPATPFVIGWEGAGHVGDRRVYFFSTVHPHGSCASQAVVKSDALLEVPEGLTDEHAIGIGIAGLSAWLPLTWETQLTGGERVLVTGATGMVGQIATQGAKLLGAGYVVAAGRDRDTLSRLRDLGADQVVALDGKPEESLATAAGPGFDLVIDCVFGGPFRAALNCVAPRGTVIVVGLTAGTQVTLDWYELYGRRVVSYAAPFAPVEEKQRAFDAMAAHVAGGRLIVDYERFGLDEIEDAWAELNKSAHRKLLIEP
jgi:NADPH:quinone reductase-like Zn-dependent oxidoreductase